MTTVVSLQLIIEFKIDAKKTYFTVSQHAASIPGTSACLQEGQKVLVYDLLYGLMLPSGNDAAVCLAENFSEKLRTLKRIKQQTKVVKKDTDGNNIKINQYGDTRQNFIMEMNRMAKLYHLSNTQYANPHGLASKANHSTAYDVATLSSKAM